MAWWVAEVTLAANAWGPQSLRDSESAPAGARSRRLRVARSRPPREEIPLAFGGHDIVGPVEHLARPWQCRCCHKSASKRATLAHSRCPGSAVWRWDTAARKTSEVLHGFAGRHCLLVTGTVVWCWKCGANACVRARRLAAPCPGRPRGFLVQARQRLLLGLHPSSRIPLNAVAIPADGHAMPAASEREVSEARASRTTACLCRRDGPSAWPASTELIVTARLQRLRERIREREALAKRRRLKPAVSPKRVRLRGKQADPQAIAAVTPDG